MSELHIDGSEGEGGGQILRTSLALAAITGQSVRFSNVRAGRSKPGLLRQHLTALRAAAEVCGARVEGDELGSQTLRFTPGTIRGGTYHFAVGTAGSACLVSQTVLPMLLLADAPSEVVFEGARVHGSRRVGRAYGLLAQAQRDKGAGDESAGDDQRQAGDQQPTG